MSTASREIGWGQFRTIRKFETPTELPDEYREILTKLLYVQGDTEFASIQQHRPWLDTAPTVEDRWTIARIVADEMRHGLQMCRLLQDFGPEGDALIKKLLSRRMGEHKLDAFNLPFDKWSDVAAFTGLIDRVGLYQLKSFEECSYAPLARAMPLMIHEEKLHYGFGYQALKRIAQDAELGGKAEAQAGVNKWYPRGLDMFGHAESDTSRLVVELGLKRWSNEEMRQMFIRDVEPLIHKLGLEVPAPDYDRRVT